jgi:hypothetical protein
MDWWRCAKSERGMVVAASLLLPIAGLALHTLGLRRTLRLFAGGANPPAAPSPEAAERLACAVEHAGRKYSIYPADCLVRSLVLVRLLRWHRITAELRVGARTLTGRFEAHAWVEHCGVALGEDADEARIYHAFDLRQSEALRFR